MPTDPGATAARPPRYPEPVTPADTHPTGCIGCKLDDGPHAWTPPTAAPSRCVIKGPYYPVGDVDFECRTHGVIAELRDPARAGAADIRCAEMRCPVGEPDA